MLKKLLFFSGILPIMILSFLFAIGYQYITKITRKDMIFIALLTFIVIVLPSLPTIHPIYTQIITSILFIIVLLTILISPFPLPTRISLIICISLIYERNLSLVFGSIKTALDTMNIPKSKKKDDKLVANLVTNLFQRNGIRLINNFEKLPKHPTMILANYCSDRIENPLCVLLPRKLSILMQYNFKRVNMDGIIHKPIYVKGHHQGNIENISTEVKKTIDEGNDLFAYINSPSYYRYVTIPKKGMFHIAVKHNISITPVTFDILDTSFGTIPSQNYFIKVGETFHIDNPSVGRHKVIKFFRESLKEFAKQKYNFNYSLS